MGETCKQSGCSDPASHRFTWPGRDESFICEKHVGKLRGVAQAMGMHLQVIPLSCAHVYAANPGMFDTSHRYCTQCGRLEGA